MRCPSRQWCRLTDFRVPQYIRARDIVYNAAGATNSIQQTHTVTSASLAHDSGSRSSFPFALFISHNFCDMRIVAVVAALAATFNSVLADVVCNSEAVHYKPRMISVAEKNGFATAIDEVCSNAGETSVQRQFESTIFSRIRTGDDLNRENCMEGLQSIVELCVAGKNAGGGSFVTNGLTVEIHLDSSNNVFRDDRAVGEKRATKPKSSTPKSKPKPAKPIPAKPIPAKPAPAKPTPPAPKPGKKPPTGKACPLKPGKGSGNGSGKGDKGKKGPTKVVRAFISKLLRRAGSAGRPSTDYGSGCDDEEMVDGGEWGVDTWRGRQLPSGTTMTNRALREIARSAFRDVMSKKKGGGGTVVAALFVPGQGVFIGSPAHGNGPAKVESFAKAKAPTLWGYMEFRTWNGQGSKYHAEDVAMLYAIETGAVKGNTKFPAGSKIAAWGKVGTMSVDKKMQPCTDGNITPGCSETIGDMEIASAYND